MTRLFLSLLGILAVTVIAVWLVDHPGAVTINFQGWRLYTSFAAIVLALVLMIALTAGIVAFAGWLKRDLPVIGKNAEIKRQGRGLKMLNQSLVALSAGDHKLARRLVEQAEILLPPQPMVHLIAAEAATRAGDHAAAQKRYQALEKTDDGRFLGLRGLVQDARRLGRESEALRLARTAFEENRKSPWVLKTLFALEVAAGNWAEADTALEKVSREKLLPDETVKRHKAALAFAAATESKLKGEVAEARKLFKKAMAARPDFAPAASALAKLEYGDGNKRRADKLIRDIWSRAPHPSLAKIFKELDAAESAADWLKRVKGLTDINPDHPDSLLLLADALMDARHYDTAKPVLERLTQEAPTRAAWQYRLALAHALGDDPDPVEAALAHARDGARWHCTDCGHSPAGWSPLCTSCGGFDTLVWQSDSISVSRAKGSVDATIALLAPGEEGVSEMRPPPESQVPERA